MGTRVLDCLPKAQRCHYLRASVKTAWPRASIWGSDKALGGVLVQEGHSVAFESWNLDVAEQRYSTHEKEMIAVIHYLET